MTPPGKVPLADMAALVHAHAELCTACIKSLPCYINTAAQALAAVDYGIPPRGEEAPAPTPSYPEGVDDELIAKVEDLLQEGVLDYLPEDKSFPAGYCNVFLATQGREARLPEEIKAAVDAGGPQGAQAAALAGDELAEAFLAVFEAELAKGGGALGEKSSADIKRAFLKAENVVLSPGKTRVVVDMAKQSEAMPPVHMRYASLPELLSGAPRGGFCIKMDIRKGFYHLLLSLLAQRQSCFPIRWRDGGVRFFYFKRLVMGARVSPFMFSLFTAIIRDILRARGFSDISIFYVDDLIIVCPTMERALETLAALRALLVELNVDASEEKTSTDTTGPRPPSHAALLLGVRCDFSTGIVSLEAGKLVRLLMRARVIERLAEAGIRVPVFALASLAGGLSNLGVVDTMIPPYTRPLAAYATGRSSWASYKSSARIVTKEERHALAWLRAYAASGDLRGSFSQGGVCGLPRPVMHFIADASGETNAIGIVSPVSALRVQLPDCCTLGVPSLELLAWPLTLQRYGRFLEGFMILRAADSLPACWTESKGRSRHSTHNDICAAAMAFMRRSGIRWTTFWVSRYLLYAADRLAAKPLAQLRLEGFSLPHAAEEILVRGLPPTFLQALPDKGATTLRWNLEEWKKVIPRK